MECKSEVCCIFGHTHRDAKADGELLTYQMALVSTHMLAEYDEWDTPFPLIYARERGLEIIRFTPKSVLAEYKIGRFLQGRSPFRNQGDV